MSRLQKLGLACLRRHSIRSFHSSIAHCSALSVPLIHDAPTPTPDTSSMKRARDMLRELKRADLIESLSRENPNPSRVWGRYIDLLDFLEFESLPLEIHQAVLRKCTPSTQELRISNARRIDGGNPPSNPHVYENRFQTIIRNIRQTGSKPTIDDYNFILDQFSAVGHHIGVMNVYKELVHLGLTPTTKTYGLCFQTIAHRQTLPCYEAFLPRILDETTQFCTYLMDEMCRHGIAFTSVNLDLIVRILKESLDQDAFLRILRTCYGIDLSYPDRPPLQVLENHKGQKDSRDIAVRVPKPLPLSTSALNTIIDFLGQKGDISKLVIAFEVLIVPLPSQAGVHFSSTFDEEDDFGLSPADPNPLYHFPNAEPNSTTFNLLIKHLSRANHSTLARHYMLHALQRDFDKDRVLRGQLMWEHPNDIPSPYFSVNRGTFLPAFGLANRYKDMELMRATLRNVQRALRRKRERVEYYTTLISENPSLVDTDSAPLPPPPETPEIDFNADFEIIVPKPVTLSPVFEVDLDSPEPPPPPVKYLDLNVHLHILRHDISELVHLERRVEDVIGRTVQRVKERLGRRVWSGKDIYLRSEERTMVTRPKWTKIVNFKPANPGSELANAPRRLPRSVPYVRPGWLGSNLHREI